MIYEIVPGRVIHIRPMARAMRHGHASSIGSFGLDPRRALHDAVIGSHYCQTALIEGRPVAMWGLKGPLLAAGAFVWLVLSNEITSSRRAIVTEARRELAEMSKHHEELATTVLPNDLAAIRLAAFLGFHDRDDEHGNMTRKALASDLLENPRHRIALPDGGHVIAIGWHRKV